MRGTGFLNCTVTTPWEPRLSLCDPSRLPCVPPRIPGLINPGALSCKMSGAALPLLLPTSVLVKESESDPHEWKPSKYRQAPQPPPTDDSKHDLEMAAARQLIDGKAFKKVRPRRTVDYFAGVGRWTLVRSRESFQFCETSRGF